MASSHPTSRTKRGREDLKEPLKNKEEGTWSCPHCAGPLKLPDGDDDMHEHTQRRIEEEAMKKAKVKANSGNNVPPFVSNSAYKPYTGGGDHSLLKTYTSCGKHWDSYYSNNGINGYKDRHYIMREFVELAQAVFPLAAAAAVKRDNKTTPQSKDANDLLPGTSSSSPFTAGCTSTSTTNPIIHWMEVGCGVGNTVMPYLEPRELGNAATGGAEAPSGKSAQEEGDATPSKNDQEQLDSTEDMIDLSQVLDVTLLDISAVAIKLLKEKPTFKAQMDRGLARGFAHDVSIDSLLPLLAAGGGGAANRGPSSSSSSSNPVIIPHQVDFMTMIFVMCSIPLERHLQSVRHLAQVVRPGGVLYFRDYCTSDMAETRFKTQNNKKQTEVQDSTGHTYVRSNGTLSHFFSEEEVVELFTGKSRTGGGVIKEEAGAAKETKGGSWWELIHIETVQRTIVNRSSDLAMERRWLHARFRRTAVAA